MKHTLYTAMLSLSNPDAIEGLMRFFKTGKGEYGEGDKFLGIKVPQTRRVVKQFWQTTDFGELQQYIQSEYHEIRLAALLTLIEIFIQNKHSASNGRDDSNRTNLSQKKCIDFYLSNTKYINNWDLVDLSCYKLLGVWLMDKDRTLLYQLAKNGKTIWEQRIGIVTTMAFIRKGELQDTFNIADILLKHPHDLIQKAVGWLLREAGKRDKNQLIQFLQTRHSQMPRTMLRYAVEKLSQTERELIK